MPNRSTVSSGKAIPKPNKPKADLDIARLQALLAAKLSASVNISYNTQGKGKLAIHFRDFAELESILARIH